MKSLLRKFGYPLLFLLALFLPFSSSFASTLYSETYSTLYSTYIFRAGYNVQKIAKQFTPTSSMNVDTVSFDLMQVYGSASASFTINVYSGGSSPESGTLIATSNPVNSSLIPVYPTSPAFVDFSFNSPFTLNPSTTYYFVLVSSYLDNPELQVVVSYNSLEWEYCPGCSGASWQDKGAKYAFKLSYLYDSSTHIVSFTPVASTTPINSPVTLSVTYNAGTDLGSSSPTLLLTLLDQDDGTYHEYNFGHISTTPGLHTLSTTTGALNNGLYHYSIVFDNFPSTVNWSAFQQASNFIVGKTTFPQSSVDLYFPATTTPTTISSGLSECDSLFTASGVGCAVGTVMKNLFYLLFVPDKFTLDRFREQYDSIKQKSPWGYIFLVINDINAYSTANTASLSSADLSITLPNTGVFATSPSVAALKGKTITFIDWPLMASATANNYWGTAWNSLNNFLTLMMGAGFFFWIFNFVTRRLHP